MKREIVFRGKSLQNGEWYLVNLFLIDTIGRAHVCTPERGRLIIDPNTVGQFTGLLDKNGKEIYEGDIVSYDDTPYCPFGKKYKGEVVVYRGAWCVKHYEAWCDEYFYSSLFSDYFANHKTVIIGNIHDNPELLKGGEK